MLPCNAGRVRCEDKTIVRLTVPRAKEELGERDGIETMSAVKLLYVHTSTPHLEG